MKELGVTFETKCWENDYKLILSTDHLRRMIDNCNYSFSNVQLIINNVNDINKVKKMANDAIKDGIINRYYVADETKDEVLKTFDINDDFVDDKGYKYSISELTGIFFCRTKYLLHFSSDSYIPKEYKNSNWVKEAIEIMENNSDIAVVNPVWNYKWDEAKKESIIDRGTYYESFGFSDQCYLINTEYFKNQVYNTTNEASSRYPKYGGELFEKRVDSFMRNNNLKRAVIKNVSYVSKNITYKQYLLEKIGIKKI